MIRLATVISGIGAIEYALNVWVYLKKHQDVQNAEN